MQTQAAQSFSRSSLFLSHPERVPLDCLELSPNQPLFHIPWTLGSPTILPHPSLLP